MQTFGGCEGIHLICWSLRPPNTLLKTVLERARQGASTELVFDGNACHSLTHKFDELIKVIVCYWSSTLTVDRWPLTKKCPFTCLTMGGRWWTVDRWPLTVTTCHPPSYAKCHPKPFQKVTRFMRSCAPKWLTRCTWSRAFTGYLDDQNRSSIA